MLREASGRSDDMRGPAWDTLLFSFVLTPWRRYHALSGSEVAHRADADASAALAHFCEQVRNLPLPFGALLHDGSAAAFYDAIAQCLQDDTERHYPAAPDFLPSPTAGSKPAPVRIVLPASKLIDCAWVPGIRYEFPSGFPDREDMELGLSSIEHALAQRAELTEHERALATVLRDAARHGLHTECKTHLDLGAPN